MYCLRWWIPLFLLPFPKTSPLFLVLFLFSFTLHSQPCMYCALILTGLFTTSSNWYSPASSVMRLDSINSTSTAISSNNSAPRSSYGWLDLGYSGGNGFFNSLSRLGDGLKPTQDADASTRDFYQLSIPWSESQVQIPKRFFVGVGKHRGLGVWVDLGSGINDAPTSSERSRTATDASRPVANLHVEL
ncbi:hypothetical protein EX895_004563 [Sporisorium graminicola]|uniref:Uncharacterized protein n=1 Tax=Sporisorium graminicola TaxID=280036 RepID=A0A4U7KPX9_9BASI|nr:hypothetical protein EX895_004563 [Sporisorium graminicola]TKY86414.1 hypothetical protein EX895_004563 [Sporisorium graminicola]